MRISSKFTFIIGMLALLFSGVSILLNHPGFALKIINFSFFVLLLATIQYIWETKIKNER